MHLPFLVVIQGQHPRQINVMKNERDGQKNHNKMTNWRCSPTGTEGTTLMSGVSVIQKEKTRYRKQKK